MPIHRDPLLPDRRRRLRAGRPLAACALAFALVAAGTTTASADDAPTAVVPVGAGDGSYLVTLRDQPAASYDGTLDGLAPTRVEPGAASTRSRTPCSATPTTSPGSRTRPRARRGSPRPTGTPSPSTASRPS
ncbi:hypothetical protein MAFF212519_23640 [Clavibacter michiganensis]